MKKLLIFLVSLCPFLSMAQNIIGMHKENLDKEYASGSTFYISGGTVNPKYTPKYADYRYDSVYVVDNNNINAIYYFNKEGICQEVHYIHGTNSVLMNVYISGLFSFGMEKVFPAKPPFFKMLVDKETGLSVYLSINWNNVYVFMTEPVYYKLINN
jgi:hypothetical protein